jgi:TRAP-type C4-dicarboxylate transport system permease small subunit
MVARLFLRVLDRLEEILIGLLMGLATIIIFVAVAQRYGLTISINLANWGRAHNQQWLFDAGRAVFFWLKDFNLTWAQELTIYMFVWMAKFGAAYGVRTGIHVGVDVALNQLGERSRYRVVTFGLLCGALFTFIVGSLGARFVWHIAQTDQTSPDMELPMWLIYIAIPIGSYLMCFRFLQVAWTFSRTGELPHHDESKVEGIADEEPMLLGTAPLDAPAQARGTAA